ncbi:MAG TPA: hypothetical protein VGM10_01955 [Actinocrinis sp.]|jgi:hypothetical protein
MGDAYIEYRSGVWRRFRTPIIALSMAGILTLSLAMGGAQNQVQAWTMGTLAATSTASALVMWIKGVRTLSVKLSSRGTEQRYTHHKRTFTPWHDIEAVEVRWQSIDENREVRLPVLVLKDGRSTTVGAIFTAGEDVSPARALFRMLPHDPRFEDKVSEMRRLLAESRDLEWSDPGAPAVDEAGS